MRGNYLKRQLFIGIMFFFLIGILYVNLTSKNIMDSGVVFNEHFFEQYKNVKVEKGKYILYLLRVRTIPISMLTALAFTRFRKLAVWGMIGWTGFLGGFLIAMAVYQMGIKGSLFCLVSMFPHMIFYIPAYLVVMWYALNTLQSEWDIQKTVFITGSMLSGILSETYISPVIVKLFISIM